MNHELSPSHKAGKRLKLSLICAAAVALNLLTVYIFYYRLGIHLFLDTIWTVAVTFYAGLVPGIATALLYEILCPILWRLFGIESDFYNMLFFICGILIVLVTWIFARRKEYFRMGLFPTVLTLVIIAFASSFCSIFVGGILDFIRFSRYQANDMVAPIQAFAESFELQGFPLFVSCILAQVPVSLLDRLITTFSGYAVYRLALKISDGRKKIL